MGKQNIYYFLFVFKLNYLSFPSIRLSNQADKIRFSKVHVLHLLLYYFLSCAKAVSESWNAGTE